jgi:hypothetical protein
MMNDVNWLKTSQTSIWIKNIAAGHPGGVNSVIMNSCSTVRLVSAVVVQLVCIESNRSLTTTLYPTSRATAHHASTI